MRRTLSVKRLIAIVALVIGLQLAYAPIAKARAMSDCYEVWQAAAQKHNAELRECRRWLPAVCGPDGDAWTCLMWAWLSGFAAKLQGVDLSEGPWWGPSLNFCDVLFAAEASTIALEYASCVALSVGKE